jgi:dienelactone hydrolase
MELDEIGVVEAWRRARAEVIDPTVARHHGRIVKLTGDGFLAEFATVESAVKAALSMQDAFATLFADAAPSRKVAFRMGVNVGDVWVDSDDIYGAGVNIAARLQALAEPGGICISGAVRDAVKHKIAARYVDMGLQHVKNVAEPVHAWRVRSGVSSAPAVAREDDDTMRTAYLSPVPPPETALPTATVQLPRPTTTQLLRQPSFIVSAALVLVVAVAAVIWSWNRTAGARSARADAVPRVAQLVEQGDYEAAFALAGEAARAVPDDPLLRRLTPLFTATFSVSTTPPDADVYVRSYNDTDGEWRLLGRSPLIDVNVARVPQRWRIEKAGFAPAERATTAQDDNLGGRNIDVSLQTASPETNGMVFVPGGRSGRTVNLVSVVAENLQPYFIDQYEVTNKAFKEFVDAGGYENPEYWAGLNFVRNGERLGFEEAVQEFVDSSGQRGPATWETGDYPAGRDDYPVSGVSWFEAAAYARFRNKSLPTVYHFTKAAVPDTELPSSLAASGAPLSNFGSSGPAAVGSHQGVGPYGTYDMLGNVWEWVWNGAPNGSDGWVLGGGWEDPPYVFSNGKAIDRFARMEVNGFRLMQAPEVAPELLAPVQLSPERNTSLQPVSDDVFNVFRAQFEYTSGPLNSSDPATVETTDDWIKQRVVLDTYGRERMSVFLFIPTEARLKRPFQALVYFPGIDRFLVRMNDAAVQPGFAAMPLDYIVRSGRVLVAPVFEGSYDRFEAPYDPTDAPRLQREWIAWRQDIGRTIDYLATREDIDSSSIGYVGVSMGGSSALPLLALEPRFKTAVLLSGGLPYEEVPPIVEPVNYVQRITLPVLMVNGKYDHRFTTDVAQQPLYDLLGTPAEDKRYVPLESGHGSLPRTQVVREVLAWLDKYLGPVVR